MQITHKSHIPYLILMQWLMLAGLISFGIFMAWDTGLLPDILTSDNTRISILILVLFFFASLHCFERSLFLSRQARLLHSYFDSLRPSSRAVFNSPVIHYLNLSVAKDEQDVTLLTEVLAEKLRGQHQIGWFVTGALIKLGLLGTVIGFMLMLGSLDNIKSMDIAQVQTLMQTMTQGMRIALNTTLLGLVSSLLLGLQYLYLDRRADQLIAYAIEYYQQQAGLQPQSNSTVTEQAGL